MKVPSESHPFDALNLPKTIQYELEKSLNHHQTPGLVVSSALQQAPSSPTTAATLQSYPIDAAALRSSKELLEHVSKLAHFKSADLTASLKQQRRDENDNNIDDAENEESNAKRFKY